MLNSLKGKKIEIYEEENSDGLINTRVEINKKPLDINKKNSEIDVHSKDNNPVDRSKRLINKPQKLNDYVMV